MFCNDFKEKFQLCKIILTNEEKQIINKTLEHTGENMAVWK